MTVTDYQIDQLQVRLDRLEMVAGVLAGIVIHQALSKDMLDALRNFSSTVSTEHKARQTAVER
jgi:hypothetical protein